MGRRLLVLAALLATAACGGQADNAAYVPQLQALLAAKPDWIDSGRLGDRLWAIEREFYAARGHLPAWVNGDRTTDHMKALLQQLRNAERHGLTSAKYRVGEFEQLRERSQTRWRGTRFDPAIVPELDAKLTYSYLSYAADLLAWDRSPRKVFQHWLTEPKTEDLARRLETAIADGSIAGSLEQLAPEHPQYQGLQAALAKERQQSSGNLDRIVMNLERWRWAPRDLGDRYVLVNVPSYQLQVVEGDKPVLAMRVIVGQPDTPTPLFSDEMTYVVFSPYWNIPESILRTETLPRVARDPSFLTRNNIEVVGTSGEGTIDAASIDWSDESSTAGLRFRQRPGADNALGLVKFLFPNHFNVYLHDTPGDRLFFRERRTFSHGCIRIENPVAMAEYVLADQPEWTRPRIENAMQARRERAVTLKEPLPVHIGYWTAWVQADGSVTYTEDPYGIDKVHARLLASEGRSVGTTAAASTPAARKARARS
jgi:murein L,D-transpeptidase YcbB/YkuD